MTMMTQDLVPLYVERGESIGLVRWSFIDGQWQYETVVGRYVGCSGSAVCVEIRGEIRELDRAAWQVFR